MFGEKEEDCICMKKKTLVLSWVLVVLLFTCAAAETFTATKDGRNGPISVETAIENGVITGITVTEQAETPEIATAAIESIPEAIVQFQTVGVDSITGATITSDAIKAAVLECIKEAGLDQDKFSSVPEKAPVEKKEVSLETDVLVIGGGGSGLTAAVTAAEQGAKVILLEKMEMLGGSTALSAGAFVGFNEDPSINSVTLPELRELVELYAANGSDYFDPQIADDFLNNLNNTIAWTLEQGYITNQDTFYPGLTRKDPKDRTSYFTHIVVQGGLEGQSDCAGAGLTSVLEEKASDLGIEILKGTPATDLLTDEDHHVCGAIAESGENKYTISAKAVILACGSFGANSDMMHKYWPDAAFDWLGSSGDTGDGIRMAEQLGAVVEPDSNCMVFAFDNPTLGVENSLFIDNLGRRAADESMTGYEMCYHFIRDNQDGATTYWFVLENDSPIIPGTYCENLEAVAELTGANVNTLRDTFTRYNELAGKEDVDFGKATDLMTGISMEGPYYLVQNIAFAPQTSAGVDVNGKMQVLNADKQPIGGLYAVGDMSNQTVYGKGFPTCGGCLNYAVYSGRIAGADAADSVK